MSYKINVSVIINDHLKTLVNARTNRPDFRDLLFFLIIPIGTSLTLILNRIFFDGDFINSIIGGLSIYVGLSLNFIVLLFDLSAKEIFKESEAKSVIKETVANISVSIFYSILIILFSLLSKVSYLLVFGNFLCYFILIEFLFTLLMILKRVYVLLMKQLDVTDNSVE